MARKSDTSGQLSPTPSTEGASAVSPARFAAGAIFLLISVGASGMLVWQHLVGSDLPGCGPESACAQAADSAWGALPVVDWPVSFLGFAYFLGLLITWRLARSMRLDRLRWIVRAGAAASLLFIVVMLSNLESYLCMYCLVAHLANFGFLAVLETTPRPGEAQAGDRKRKKGRRKAARAAAEPGPLQPVANLAIAFVAISVVLGSWNLFAERQAEGRAQEEMRQATEAVAGADGESSIGFEGRYRWGPERAAVRIVVFTGYQCEWCKRTEDAIEPLLERYGNIAMSVKHYPINTDCNPYVQRNIHPNGCWAARAAEAAGILDGADGFWRMHHWLFEQGGGFTDRQLVGAVQRLGFNVPEFLEVMQSRETLELVQADIEEAREFGIQRTPMVFVNGVELRGWRQPADIRRMIEDLATRDDLEARTAAEDRPPEAFEKAILDWELADRVRLPEVTTRSIGPRDATVQIDMWGDYIFGRTKTLDRRLRRIVEQRSDVRYTYRYFPINEECNPAMTTDASEHGCLLARAAEAVASLYGHEGYWQLHEWIMRQSENDFSERRLRDAMASMGFDVDEVYQRMDSPAVQSVLQREARDAMRTSGRRVAPQLAINGRYAPTWELPQEDRDVLMALIDAAAEEAVGR